MGDTLTDLARRLMPLMKRTIQQTIHDTPSIPWTVHAVIAGAGLTGGGQLVADVILNAGAGDGIDVDADSVAVDATDLVGAGLVEDASNNIMLGTPSTLTVATTNNVSGTTHTHAVTSSSNPGAAAALLASSAAGALTLVNLGLIGNVTSDLIPSLTDAYDIGSSTKLWRKGYLSELDAVIFAEQTVSLVGGWLIIPKDQGSYAADVAAGATTVDFGKAMMVGDFIMSRASLKVEYMQVGTLVSGTTYNVTRNLDGSGANDWPAGTPYLVLGATGDGRIELNAYDTPRIQIVEQGATYNAQTERVRIGDMRDSFGTGSNTRYGLGVGNYAGGNYLSYNAEAANKFIIKAGAGKITLDETGLRMERGTGINNQMSWVLVGTSTVRASIRSDASGLFLNFTNDGATARSDIEMWGTQIYFGIGGTIYMTYNASHLDLEGIDLRTTQGLLVGSTGSTPAAGDIVVANDGRFGGGLYVGGTGTDPAADQIVADGTITSGNATSAKAAIGQDPAHGSSYAGFWNNALTRTATNYCLLQNSSGDTYLNSETGRNLTLQVGNTTLGYFEGSTGNFRLVNKISQSTAIGCRAYHNAAQSINDATWTALAFNSERFDNDGIHDPATNNSRLTCVTAGVYLIVGMVQFASNNTGFRGVGIRRGGTQYIAVQTQTATQNNVHQFSISAIYDMAATNYVELMVYQNSGGSLNVDTVDAVSAEFGMVRIA